MFTQSALSAARAERETAALVCWGAGGWGGVQWRLHNLAVLWCTHLVRGWHRLLLLRRLRRRWRIAHGHIRDAGATAAMLVGWHQLQSSLQIWVRQLVHAQHHPSPACDANTAVRLRE